MEHTRHLKQHGIYVYLLEGVVLNTLYVIEVITINLINQLSVTAFGIEKGTLYMIYVIYLYPKMSDESELRTSTPMDVIVSFAMLQTFDR